MKPELMDRQANLCVREQTVGLFEGCSHVIHLAAEGNPGKNLCLFSLL
jgi:hypothetical protein